MVEVVIGRIGRAHGVRGEVSVDLRTDEPDRRFLVGNEVGISPARSLPSLRIASVRPHSGRLLVSFEQVRDRTAAEQLRGAMISVDVDPGDRPEDPEEFYDHQLVGLRVRSAADAELGTVDSVLHLPAHDVLAVRLADGREVLVPFVADMVPVVDVDAGFVEVVDTAGLLEAAEAHADLAAGSGPTTTPG
jgi:16S rRNA processing protein RimM